ncbi:MAG: hypothetical protein SP1CHLAM54_07550 [Chlamydiia bacterium]|nr:hypothetical protein [Chlamydiia bacterium]MCH9615661.1 hypothetical protein [Chlamydiia bacterium]MCH9628936.1 hypothetical protein [Chlamydiia bacterium]
MKAFFVLLLSSLSLFAYDPWYTGPLLAISGSNEPPGRLQFQPFFFVSSQYASYQNNWSTKSQSNTTQLNYSNVFQSGITNWLDASFFPQFYTTYSEGERRTKPGDTSLSFGLKPLYNKRNTLQPDVRLSINFIFPTGKYDQLNPETQGTDAVGGGAYSIQPTLVLRKWFFMFPNHPFRINLNTTFETSSKIFVKDLNIFGGGHGTRGWVSPGNEYSNNLSLELSLTQRWVFVTELLYSHTWSSSFSGTVGPAPVGTSSSDLFSIANEIEYNVTGGYGWVGGVWYTVAGRNSTAFLTFALSFYYEY